MQGETVVAAARGWLGTPWHHQGRLKGVGVDCVGLVIGVARELGLSTFDVTGYPRRPGATDVLNGCRAHMTPVMEPMPGDVLAFAIDGQVQHLAIASDIGMIHALAAMRRVVEHRLGDVWQARLAAAFRLPGVNPGARSS